MLVPYNPNAEHAIQRVILVARDGVELAVPAMRRGEVQALARTLAVLPALCVIPRQLAYRHFAKPHSSRSWWALLAWVVGIVIRQSSLRDTVR
jgi:hypothetical protein